MLSFLLLLASLALLLASIWWPPSVLFGVTFALLGWVAR